MLDYVDEEYALKNYVRNNSYNFEEYPNAIDPTVFYDADDRMWMVYGSWSGGIFLLERPVQPPKFGERLRGTFGRLRGGDTTE